MDTIYLKGRGTVSGLFNKKYIRTRVMRFDSGNTIINLEDVKSDPTIEMQQSLRFSIYRGPKKIIIQKQYMLSSSALDFYGPNGSPVCWRKSYFPDRL